MTFDLKRVRYSIWGKTRGICSTKLRFSGTNLFEWNFLLNWDTDETMVIRFRENSIAGLSCSKCLNGIGGTKKNRDRLNIYHGSQRGHKKNVCFSVLVFNPKQGVKRH